MTTTLTLSNVRPDFLDLVSQLQAALGNYASWKDFLTSATGQTLVEFQSAIGAYDQYGIESTLQEAYPVTAKNDSSIFAAVQMLGVRLNRKSPAQLTATFTAPVATTIPALSQFTGASSYFFNRDVIQVPASPSTVTANLYQGKVIGVSISGLGTDYQAFVTPENDFTVSDSDIYVTIDDVAIEVIRNGLWQLKQKPGVQDTTLSDGRAVILFGSDFYGSKPGVTNKVTLTYAVTAGLDGNNLDTNGKAITYDIDPAVVVTGTSSPSGGANQNSATVYKSVAAPVFGAFGSAVTRDQYVSTPFLYSSNIVDAVMFAQREINPNALKWMNVVKVILLTNTPWVQSQYDAFFQWLQDQTMYAVRFVNEIPSPALNNVNVDVFCTNAADLLTVKTNVTNAINALFSKKPGILNKNFYRSDITEAIFNADTSIEYIILNAPTDDMIIAREQMGAPSATPVAGGSLTPGAYYDYAVSYVAIDGSQYAPTNWTNVQVTGVGNGSVQLTWNAISHANQYKVWGRQSSGTLGLLATLANNVLTYTDTGTDPVVPPLLEEDIVVYRYNALGTLTLTTNFSTRRKV